MLSIKQAILLKNKNIKIQKKDINKNKKKSRIATKIVTSKFFMKCDREFIAKYTNNFHRTNLTIDQLNSRNTRQHAL